MRCSLYRRIVNYVSSSAWGKKEVLWGVDWGRDVARMARRHGALRGEVVCVDVGAHAGEVATEMARLFPDGRVFAFEMVPETFAILQSRTAHIDRIVARQVGLSNSIGEVLIEASGMSQRNSWNNSWALRGERMLVHTKTLDGVADEEGIDRILLLKTDTEGHDYAVLQGGGGLLASGRIEYVIVEVGLDSRDEQHSDFFKVRELLESFGYLCVGVYSQWRPVVIGHWADALFVRRMHLEGDWRGTGS